MSQEYLDRKYTQEELKRFGEEIARESLQKNCLGSAFHATSFSLAVTPSVPPSSSTSPSGTSDVPEPNTKAYVNTSSAFKDVEGSLQKAYDEQI